MTSARWKVPASWKWVTAGDVAEIVGGGTPSTKDEGNFAEPGKGVPWIGPADLTGYQDIYIGRGRRDLSEAGVARSGATLMPEGTVLFSSRAPIGYCAIAANSISTNQGFKSWVCSEGLVPEYVRHYLLSSTGYVDSLASGTTFREISGRRVAGLALPLAPTTEQRRIVAMLDALTARLARARAELDRVPVLSRKALAAAYEEVFCGANGVRHSSLASLTPPDAPIIYGILQPGPNHLGGIPYVRPTEIDDGAIKIPEVRRTTHAIAEQYRRATIRSGDILLTIVGTIGKVAVVPEELDGGNITQSSCRIRPANSVIDGEYLRHWLLSPHARRQYERRRLGTAVPRLNIRDIREFKVPILPLDEQQRIAERLTCTEKRLKRLEVEAARARALLDRLEAAILDKAFRGELVPQDPEDEPASVLLERIRARRAAAPKVKRGRRKGETADA